MESGPNIVFLPNNSILVGPRELIETIPKCEILKIYHCDSERATSYLIGACYFTCWTISFISKLTNAFVLYHLNYNPNPKEENR